MLESLFKKFGIHLCIIALGLLMCLPATAQDDGVLKGSMFVTTLSGNTISGESADGLKFHVYILSGGIATFVDENDRMDVGRWHIRKDDDAICVKWQKIDKQERCAIVTKDGRTLLLDGDIPVGEVKLLGTVVTGFE